MDNIQKKDKVQRQAIEEWVNHDRRGTTQIVTGLGKTFIALHALYTLPKDDRIHYFFAEVVDRRKDLRAQIDKYNKIFNRDVLNDYKLKFATYQSACKWKGKEIGLAIFDEIHELLTPKRFKLFENNSFDYTLGLSATIDLEHYYSEIRMSKGDMLNEVAPICYSYGLDESIANGTTRNLNIYVISHDLDARKRTVPSGSAKRKFYQTESKAYEFWDSFLKKALANNIDYNKKTDESLISYNKRISKLEEERQSKINISMSKRSKILYDLPSKIPIVKTLLKHLNSRSIIFSNSLDSLLKITPNVVSSRNRESVNESIRNKFETKEIDVIGSFRKLEQGANLPDLDNVIMMSYYSKSKSLIQRLGRLRDNGKVGNVFIILTRDTQEGVWFVKMLEDINNLNLIYCNGVEDCLKKLKCL